MNRTDDYLMAKGVGTLNRKPGEAAYSGGVVNSLNVKRKVNAEKERKPVRQK